MFRGTREGFHCMKCGKSLPDREIMCKNCFHEMKRRGDRFTMTPLPAHERMEHL